MSNFSKSTVLPHHLLVDLLGQRNPSSGDRLSVESFLVLRRLVGPCLVRAIIQDSSEVRKQSSGSWVHPVKVDKGTESIEMLEGSVKDSSDVSS